jgi:hypothetical protein
VRFRARVSAIHPRAPKPFNGRAVFDPNGVHIRGRWGHPEVAYRWPSISHARLLVADVRGPGAGNWTRSVGQAGWAATAAVAGAGEYVPGLEVLSLLEILTLPFAVLAGWGSPARRSGTLELAATDGLWYLRVLHRSPSEVAKALRPFGLRL